MRRGRVGLAAAGVLLGASALAGGCSDPDTRQTTEPTLPPSTSSSSPTPSDHSSERARSSSARCFGRKATAVGTVGEDLFRGRAGRDVIVAGGGDDRISHLSAEDRVCAGPGNDVVSDVNGYGVQVSLGDGNDRIDLVHLPDLFAGAGDDIVVVTLRNVTGAPVHLGPGDDLLRVRTDPARPPPRYGEVCIDYGRAVRPIHVDLTRGVARGEGRDRIVGVRCVYGSPGRDYVVGSTASDYIEDWRGSLHVDAMGGDDFVNGSRDDDVVILGSGRDAFSGYRGNDRAYGGPGPDDLTGDDGVDVLHGGPGDDRLAGGPPCDFTYSDPLRADGSPNRLYGGPGDDLLVGDIGNDFLHGGSGGDRGFGQDDGLLDTLVSVERPFYCQ